MRRSQTVVAIESSGEYLKLAQVTKSSRGKEVVSLLARTVVLQEDLSKLLSELSHKGIIPADAAVIVSTPRNLVTVRNLQLPTSDPKELREMINLQAVKQTPFLKDEIIADFQVVRSSPEGYTDVVLVTTHRSVSNGSLKHLDDAGLQAAAIHLSSQGVVNTYRMIEKTGGEGGTDEALAIVDIDSSYSDFIVVQNGKMCFTKALSVGPAKHLRRGEKEIEKFIEEIQRAIEIYGNEGVGRRISRLILTGAEIRSDSIASRLAESLERPVEWVSLTEQRPELSSVLDLPGESQGAISFSSVLGLAWQPEDAPIDLTPHEVRLREALAQKGKVITSIGISVILLFTAITVFITQVIHQRKQYLEELRQEVSQTDAEAAAVAAMKKKIRLIGDAPGFENSSLDILAVLHQKLPPDVYLKSVTFEDGSHLILQGIANKMSEVFGFLSTLEKQPNFHHVKTKHITRNRKKDGEEEINFEITCLLTNNGKT